MIQYIDKIRIFSCTFSIFQYLAKEILVTKKTSVVKLYHSKLLYSTTLSFLLALLFIVKIHFNEPTYISYAESGILEITAK